MNTAQSLTPVKLDKKDLLTLKDLKPTDIQALLDLGIALKEAQRQGTPHRLLEGKTLAMIFEKSSTRTRISFETGMVHLGGHALNLTSDQLQLGRGESIYDTAKVFSEYVDGVMIRTFSHAMVEELAEHAAIPVINGLTDDYHPCQVLADLMTIYEVHGALAGKRLAYIGDGNNMAHSLMIGCAKMGMECVIASPKGYQPSVAIVQEAQDIATSTGGSVLVTDCPEQAVAGADAVYTDVWASMGWEEEQKEREKAFKDYQVNETLVAAAKDDFLFLHCLPAHRGEEVTAGVIDGPNSAVFQEAGNRLHVQKALLASLLSN
ncbi:ornithine carbamoyltransferase [Bacillaceae bacterium SIJ1]|uniref:ornithine carbamoyltransferase n=1 Tax=Litoribacterium kuwaitense TaxID=1398745 RepID=UPI0013EA82D3|nr:ornithine carbamoyltransferase [Litoribacterium kuwaitense]NGP44554.1 ornithine carbamoyltransferase [Litoribacterium kuwaitense]